MEKCKKYKYFTFFTDILHKNVKYLNILHKNSIHILK